MNLTFPDLLGHIGYASLVLGTVLIAHKQKIGWPLRAFGEALWIIVGIMLDLTSAWFWGTVFVFIDLHGYYKWRKEAQKST
jgi:hypothetical protein